PKSSRRPATWAGPTKAAAATAAAGVAPASCNSCGKWAAIAVLVNHVTVKTRANRGIAEFLEPAGSGRGDHVSSSVVAIDLLPSGTNKGLRGKPMMRCAAAQTKHVMRQPISTSK